jgi:hypothetical protein
VFFFYKIQMTCGQILKSDSSFKSMQDSNHDPDPKLMPKPDPDIKDYIFESTTLRKSYVYIAENH